MVERRMINKNIADQLQDALEEVICNHQDIEGLLYANEEIISNINAIASNANYKTAVDIPDEKLIMLAQEFLAHRASVFALFNATESLINKNNNIANKADDALLKLVNEKRR